MAITRVAIITGASRGLGLAMANEFAASGWKVIGTGQSPEPDGLPEGAVYRQFDASDAVACESFWKEFSKTSQADEVCLVNNAGGYVSGTLLNTTPEDYEQQMRSCYFTSVYMTRGLVSVVLKARIINIISTSALKPSKSNSAYGAAKAAQMHFFQSLQLELEPDSYQITNLYPHSIASHGPAPEAVTTEDLSVFVREQAENAATYYLRDVTVCTR